ncbi:MAG: hypothetical protein ACYC3S_13285 [Chloroflexota bacterium]
MARSHRFEDQAQSLHLEIRRLDEQLRGLEWVVANNPEYYPEVPGTKLRVAKTQGFPNAPRLRIHYTIDNAHVCTLQHMEPLESEPDS